MKKNVMFKFGKQVKEGFPPMPRDESRPPVASILDEKIREWLLHRPRWIAEPPNGYGSIVCPKKAVVDKQFTITATFAPQPFDALDPIQQEWWNDIDENHKQLFPIEIKIESTKAFDISQTTQTFNLGNVNRVVSVDFLARALVSGTHSLKVILKYPGATQDVPLGWDISVRSKIVDMIQKLGILIGVLLSIIALLKVMHVV